MNSTAAASDTPIFDRLLAEAGLQWPDGEPISPQWTDGGDGRDERDM
ncbi:hypothetical protein AB5J62_22635 [Amycolatopsis sp. cg5]